MRGISLHAKLLVMALIEIVEGDITEQDTDAIVNAAKSSLLGGGGVDGAIHRAGGPAIVEECKRLCATRYPDGLPTGQALATTGGRLRAKWVIHTVGPVYDESPDPARELASCIRSSLEVADGLGAKSVAFPAIATGAYGYPLCEAGRVSIRAVRSAKTRVERVRFVLFGAEAHATFLDANHVLDREPFRAPEEERATPDAWRTEPFPALRARIAVARRIDAAEYERLAYGMIPQEMEDKWFIYLRDGSLYFHRSWTGFCIFVVRLQEVPGGWAVAEAWVNREPEQYKSTDVEHDVLLLRFLIERLLLGRRVAFPGKRDADYPILRHQMVGYGRANDEER
jgi:O-acetyl-ADP-ribose deacetylase (regulator of RNase III)